MVFSTTPPRQPRGGGGRSPRSSPQEIHYNTHHLQQGRPKSRTIARMLGCTFIVVIVLSIVNVLVIPRMGDLVPSVIDATGYDFQMPVSLYQSKNEASSTAAAALPKKEDWNRPLLTRRKEQPIVVPNTTLLKRSHSSVATQYQRKIIPPTSKTISSKNQPPPEIKVRPRTDGQKPTFILHVGPQKTMSTALQCSVRHHEQVLALDSYKFMGKIDRNVCGDSVDIGRLEFPLINKYNCLEKMMEINNNASDPRTIDDVLCWKNHTQVLQKHLDQKHNMIVSNEKYSEIHVRWWDQELNDFLWPRLMEELKDWNVHVVVVYRRYYEWIASLKNQGDKYYYGFPGMRLWHGPTIIPLVDYLNKVIQDDSQPSPFIPDTLKIYKDLGFNVTLMNMHDGRDLIESFLCEVLPDAPQSCDFHRTHGGIGDKKINPSVSPFYDMIIMEAWKRNLIKDRKVTRTFGLQRHHVSKWAEWFHRAELGASGAMDFPLICPDEETLRPILEKTLEYEQQILPEFYASPLGEPKLREEFQRYVDKKKFCSVDIEAVLSDPHWIAWLAALKGREKDGRPMPTDHIKLIMEKYKTNLAKLQASTEGGVPHEKKDKPDLILHVGPQKTMSTALQCNLRGHENFLATDGYKFVGKIDFRVCGAGRNIGDIEAPLINDGCVQSMMAMGQAGTSNPCWKQFEALLDQYREEGQSLIMSNEKYSEIHLRWWKNGENEYIWPLVKAKLLEHWNVRVVVVYRRYYEWLPSVKNQGDKYDYGFPGMKKWTGPVIQPIYPQLKGFLENDSQPSPFVPDIVRFYKDLGFNVTLMNMHDGRDLVETFLCEVLPDATETCQYHRENGGLESESINPSVNPFYDMITHAAWKRKLIVDRKVNEFFGLRRKDVAKYSEAFHRHILHQPTPNDFPLICPTEEEYQPFLEKTIEAEKELLPDFFNSPQGETKVRSGFQKFMLKKKLCYVNVDEVLEDPRWIAFYGALRGRPTTAPGFHDWPDVMDRYVETLRAKAPQYLPPPGESLLLAGRKKKKKS